MKDYQNAVFYSLIALFSMIWGIYKEDWKFLVGGILVGLVSFYWIQKVWKK